MYTRDLVINVPAFYVRKFAMDPFIISGISGHIAILGSKGEKDMESSSEAETEKVLAQPNEFNALFILPMRGGGSKYVDGIFKGPEVTMDGIKYYGRTNDGKLEFEGEIITKSLGDNSTRVYFSANIKYNDSFMDRLLGKSAEDFAKHIVEKHFIRYAKMYLPSYAELFSSMGKNSSSSVSLSPISEFTGDAGSLLAKMNEVMSQLNLGVIKMSFDKLNCSIVVENKTMKKAMCKSDKEIRTGLEAISMIITTATKGQGKMQVYAINVEDLIESLAVLA